MRPGSVKITGQCGCSSMVEHQPSKLDTRVRFPSPAPRVRTNCAPFRPPAKPGDIHSASFVLPFKSEARGFGFVFGVSLRLVSIRLPAPRQNKFHSITSLGEAGRHSFRYICFSFQIRSSRLRICFFWCLSAAGSCKNTRFFVVFIRRRWMGLDGYALSSAYRHHLYQEVRTDIMGGSTGPAVAFVAGAVEAG